MGIIRKKNTKKSQYPLETTMSLGDHLEEFRTRLIHIIIGLLITSAIRLGFGKYIITFIRNLRDPFGLSVCMCDIDADGYAEVIVGTRGYNSFQGLMYLYWGEKDIDTKPDLVFNGEISSDFGGDTIKCDNFNDDKYNDILSL